MQKQIIHLFWHYSKPYSRLRNFALINSVLTITVSFFVGPYILSQIFTSIQSSTITLETSWPLIGWFALTQIYGEIIGWRLNLLCIWLFESAGQRDMYKDIFTKLSNESLDFHSDRFSGSLVSQATKLNGSYERFWDTIVFQVMPVATSIIAATVILWFYFWQYALFLLIVSIAFIFAVFYGSRFMRKRNIAEAQASTKMTGRLADMITNVTAVKSYGNEKSELQSADILARDWRDKTLSTMRGFLSISTLYSTLNTTLIIAALIFAIIASEQHLISIATVYLALTYTFTVSRQLWDMNNIMRNYNRILGDANDMTEILMQPTKLIDTSTEVLIPKKGQVTMKDVSFAHNEGKGIRAFHDFSLAIAGGQRIGVVGHSGSGKTTLTRLLLRFSDVDSGSIKIDDQNIASVTQQSLRQAIAYVPQEPMLFHRSLRENIAYGKLDATDEEIIQATKKANAWEFIQQLPEGLDTMVGERGVKLSGGQRQRIAIARAILKDAPILILDEATSALDSESEKLIQAALDKLMKNRTSIVIAHRLSTIAKLDRIIVLDSGRIIEDGSHRELLARNGIYASLWSHQSGGFIEE
jgi:ATP-binding cassette, subfamily B, bacterial